MRWLNCTIKHLSTPRLMRKGHTARHIKISGIPLYQPLAPNTDYCYVCDMLHYCIHSTDNEKEAWSETI